MGWKGTPELNLDLEYMERYRASIGRSVNKVFVKFKLMESETGRKKKE